MGIIKRIRRIQDMDYLKVTILQLNK